MYIFNVIFSQPINLFFNDKNRIWKFCYISDIHSETNIFLICIIINACLKRLPEFVVNIYIYTKYDIYH